MLKVGAIFIEFLKLLPGYQLDKPVEKNQNEYYCKSFTAWRQFITMLYSQIKAKDSLRDIVTGLRTQSN